MGSFSTESLPYWLVNVQREKWPAECPEYLQNLSAKDVKHLGVRDEDYHWLTWEEVCDIVATDRLDEFFRLPSELRRYRWYCWTLARDYGSVMNYMLQERLQWTDLEPSNPVPFASENDYKILLNDWPYGIDRRIVHIVIWTKTLFNADKDSGELTTDAKALIEDFVQRTFAAEVQPDKLIWFKNPISLRSVRAVEHFHVMLFDPDPTFVARVTNHDVPTSQRSDMGTGEEYP